MTVSSVVVAALVGAVAGLVVVAVIGATLLRRVRDLLERINGNVVVSSDQALERLHSLRASLADVHETIGGDVAKGLLDMQGMLGEVRGRQAALADTRPIPKPPSAT